MKWNNLKRNKCPRDGRYLQFNDTHAYCSCDFVINLIKLGRISEERVVKQLAAPLPDPDEPWWSRD